MTTQFDDELEPRSAIPLSDAEIKDIYVRAAKVRPVRYTRAERNRAHLADAAVLFAALILVAVLAGVFRTLAEILGVSVTAFILGTLLYGSQQWKKRTPVGYFTYRLFHRGEDRLPNFDPSDTQVLAVVVDHISKLPLDVSNHLKARIEKDRRAIAESLHELRQIEQSLRDELNKGVDPPMRLLLESRRETSLTALDRLMALDSTLAVQLREASEAVRPILQMKEKFEQLRRLGASLSRIQAAHGLLSSGESNTEEYRLELQVLRAAVSEANAKLHDIQRLVEAQEHAQDELARL
jgi:DNA repair exonuclease SbcCD ATPase subunit